MATLRRMRRMRREVGRGGARTTKGHAGAQMWAPQVLSCSKAWPRLLFPRDGGRERERREGERQKEKEKERERGEREEREEREKERERESFRKQSSIIHSFRKDIRIKAAAVRCTWSKRAIDRARESLVVVVIDFTKGGSVCARREGGGSCELLET